MAGPGSTAGKADALNQPLLSSGTLGEQRHRTEHDGLVVSETFHVAGSATEPHAHERAGFNLVLEGGYGERMAGAFDIHPPATVIVKPAGEPHANRFERAGARCLLVEFEPAALDGLHDLRDALERPAVWAAGPLAAQGVRAVAAIRGEGPPPVAIEEAVLAILRDARRHRRTSDPGTRPGWLARVRDRLHATAPDRVRMSELADDAGVHRGYLSGTFRRVYGVTVTGYVERLRLERATRELAATDDPVARIAVRCGFYDHAQMTRVFRRATGITPSGFRRALRT